MKILQVVICLFLLCAVTHAEPLDDLLSFRKAVLSDQGLDYDGATATSVAAVDSAVNRACYAISTFYPAVPKLDTVYSTEDLATYPFNTDFMSVNWIRTNQNDTVQFRIIGSYFVRFPTPDNADTLVISYNAEANEMASSSDTTYIIRMYRERVVDYANYLVAKLRSNYGAAGFYLKASGLSQ